ncbi:hypothetical protein [uncultured Kordia sp.]|uniref:hypothetical protein n=1 Tax=uncultured Kordia sp. TaxID=507699 RepID=UPI002616DFD8|nr:hypothetical protein [uncultured Kordia sp.]
MMKKTLKILLLAFGLLCFNCMSANATITKKMESVMNDYAVLPSNFDWSQAASFSPNIVWVIRSDFDLGGITVNMPVNVTLRFEGGMLLNGTLRGDNTKIEAPLVQIFETSIALSGTIIYDTFYPEWYGAKGDLSVDDYAAINAACQNADHVTLSQEYLMATNQRILIDRTGDFTLLGYGSLITNTTTTHINVEMFQFMNLDALTIKGATIDGRQKIATAFKIENVDNVTLTDVTISNLLTVTAGFRAAGIHLEIIDGSVVNGDNLRISEIGGGQDNSINEGVGIGRALFCNLNYSNILTGPERTKVTMTNSVFEWVYGDDGDIIHIVDQNYISDAAHRFIFDNCTIRYASRRLVKGSASGIQYYNCKFDTANEADLSDRMEGNTPQPSGGVNFRNENPDDFPDFRNMYGKMINCEYRNSGKLTIGSGSRLLVAYTDGVELRGNNFYNMGVKLQNGCGNAKIVGNTFHNTSIQVFVDSWDNGRTYITDNIGYYISPVTADHPAFINVKSDFQNVTVRGNKIFSDETFVEGVSTSSYLGLIRHTLNVNTGIPTTASEVYVSQNQVVRTNTSRSELMYSNQLWDSSCKVFDNFNNRTGLGARFNYVGPVDTAGNVFFLSWGNIDGNGNPINN